MSSQLVLLLKEGAPETRTPAVRGGKGASLVELFQLGLPVPPAFTITTSVARAYAQEGKLPKRLTWQLDRALKAIEQESGKRLGSNENPLLVSVRSGAAVSMPGMMDTVLNVGLNDVTVQAVAKQFGESFAFDSYRRLLAMFGQTVLEINKEEFSEALMAAKELSGVNEDWQLSPITLQSICDIYKNIIAKSGKTFPQDPLEQLSFSIFAVLKSWNSERAEAYRQSQHIPGWWGTAVTVQSMVFGNRDSQSGTGVVFSRNPATGELGMYGEFLPNAQGEDVVAGIRTPISVAGMREWNPGVYAKLQAAVANLEDHFNDIVDVEYTVEQGHLFILQCRAAKRTAQAAATFAVHGVWQGRWNRREALHHVTDEQISHLTSRRFQSEDAAPLLAVGLPASPGAVVGKAVFCAEKAVAMAKAGEEVILIRPDTSPDDLAGMLVAKGLVTRHGGTTSHAAVVARGLGIPAVVGCVDLVIEGKAAMSSTEAITEGDIIALDGATGKVFVGKLPFTEAILTREVKSFVSWLTRFPISHLPQPKMDFASFTTVLNANTALNDFYIVDAMAQAAKDSLCILAGKLRAKIHSSIAEVFACYLAVAVASELSYTNSCTGQDCGSCTLNTQQQDAWKQLQDWFQPNSFNRWECYQKLVPILAESSTAVQITFFQLAECVFCDNWDSSFGGPKWAAIARAPMEFLSGRLNHTAFVDHVFDLKHNGGQVFGKHRMIGCDSGTLAGQLDIKKTATTVSQLYSQLRHTHANVSPEVVQLYEQGQQQGLW